MTDARETPSWQCPVCHGNGRVHQNPFGGPERHDLKAGERPRPGTVPPIGYKWKIGRDGRVTQHRHTWWDRNQWRWGIYIFYVPAFLCGALFGAMLWSQL